MKASLVLNPTSERPEEMIAFYRDVVGLVPQARPDSLGAGDATFEFDSHRETAGMTKEPSRFLYDFWVADVAREEERMRKAGANFIRSQGTEEWGGIISTFVDPDGNYGQIMQVPGGEGARGEITGLFLDITTGDKDRMLAFYRDILGFEPFPAVGPYGLTVSEKSLLHFDTHSETCGPNQEPSRLLIDFVMEDIAFEQARLEGLGVRFFRKGGTEFWGGTISSFLDPDGNILQLIGYDPALDSTANAQG